MRKVMMMAFLVALGVFCLAPVSMADDHMFDLYVDYSQLSESDFDADFLTVGMDYQYNSLLLGGYFSTSTSIDPDPEGLDLRYQPFLFYGGYDFVKSDKYVFGIVGSYIDFKVNVSAAIDDIGLADITSLGVGFKAEGNWNSFKASLLYLYGIKNDIDVLDTSMDEDFDFNFIQLKCSYFFNDRFGLNAVYRSYDIDSVSLDGLGVGVNFKF